MQDKMLSWLFTLMVIISYGFIQEVRAANLDLSSLFPSRIYWLVHINSAFRMRLMAVMLPEHAGPGTQQGSTLHFYSLPQSVSPFWPSASSILNANWQLNPQSVQISQNGFFTNYLVSHGEEQYSVEATGRSNCDSVFTSGADRLRNLQQLLWIGGISYFFPPLGVTMYTLWHVWNYLMAPHSTFSVLAWLQSAHRRREGSCPEPPFSVPPLSLNLAVSPVSDITMEPMEIRTGLMQPLQVLMSGVSQQNAPSVPDQLANDMSSGSEHGSVEWMVYGAHHLCGGLQQFAIRGCGNALIWERPSTSRGMQAFHGGYFALISHPLMMRTSFFRGSPSERQQLNQPEPDFLKRKKEE